MLKEFCNMYSLMSLGIAAFIRYIVLPHWLCPVEPLKNNDTSFFLPQELANILF